MHANHKFSFDRLKPAFQLFIPLFSALYFWIFPAPAGLHLKAWHLLGIFIATMTGIMMKSLPMGAMAFLGFTASILTHTITLEKAMQGFSNEVAWMIFSAFLISRAFIKTGLGTRVAYFFLSKFGFHSLGIGYGLALTDLLFAPAMPSTTARVGGMIYPILYSISAIYKSKPEDGTAGRLGQFLILVAFHANVITSAMFITAHAPNPIMVQMAASQFIHIGWNQWALAALLPGIISLIFIPLIIYKICPPEVKKTPDTPHEMKTKLKKMGPLSSKEWIIIGTFVLLLILWILGNQFHLSTTTTAFLGVSILILTNTLNWSDILNEKPAWDTLFWFSILITLAQSMNQLGLMSWIQTFIPTLFKNLSPTLIFSFLVLIYYYAHYLFASNTAHITALYPAFLSLAIGVGVPPLYCALVFTFISSLMGGMTHYSNGPAPLLFGSAFVPIRLWWKVGFLSTTFYLIIWLGIGTLWWKFLGYLPQK